jgi:fumarate reductase flavoprotein subunit
VNKKRKNLPFTGPVSSVAAIQVFDICSKIGEMHQRERSLIEFRQMGVEMTMSDMPTNTDVLVLGCGAAGLSAAIEAADLGLKVVALESEDELAGSTRLSAGHCSFYGTGIVEGSREEFAADLRDSHHGDDDPELVELYLNHVPGAYRRLVDDLGFHYDKSLQLAHMRRAWMHELSGDVRGGAEIGRLLEVAARQRGVDIRVAARARRLIRNDAGRVVGAEVETTGGVVTILAAKGVVLATGGFTRNLALMTNFGGPNGARMLPIGGSGCRGDGLIMALALGAATSFISAGVAPTGPAEPKTQKGSLVAYCGAVLLNSDGERFANEAGMYSDVSVAALKQEDETIFQIYDETVREAYKNSMWGRVLTGFPEFKSDTLEELFDQIAAERRFDAQAAVATLGRYNESVRRGHDPEFGRDHMVGTAGKPTEITTGPFYGIITVPGTTQNNGGLKVDGGLRVIDVFGKPIDGLYAAGEIVGGFHGNGYLSGTHVGMALVFGQLAGKAAAGAAKA